MPATPGPTCFDKKEPSISYSQPTKQAARKAAISHAVELLTVRREDCTIAPDNYINKVIKKLKSSGPDSSYSRAANKCKSEDVLSWRKFRSSTIGMRKPEELTVAYLAGPEPINDIAILTELGVRPENIWAFELDEGVFASALTTLKCSPLRGVKLMNTNIEDYFVASPRRFDIIYYDACAPLPSHEQKTARILSNIFKHSALAPLGVLITNFSKPDIDDETACNNYTNLIANYLYPKSFLDSPEDSSTSDSAEAEGYWIPSMLDDIDPEEHDDYYPPHKNFVDIVRRNFDAYYGSFITRHIADIAAIIAPSVRGVNSSLSSELVSCVDAANQRGQSMITPQNELGEEILNELAKISSRLPEFGSSYTDAEEADHTEVEQELNAFQEKYFPECTGGEALECSYLHSILYTLALCNLAPSRARSKTNPGFKFYDRWASQLTGSTEKKSAIDAISVFYALRHDDAHWPESLKDLKRFDYDRKMPFLCDVATDELSFYPPFAQVSYPAHNKVSETKRYQYVAEGKTTSMFLDVLPFDECRYIYDWLSTAPLISEDWSDTSRQLVFRFALDAIVKNKYYYQDDYFYGCNVVSTDGSNFEPPQYEKRKKIKSKT